MGIAGGGVVNGEGLSSMSAEGDWVVLTYSAVIV